MPTIEERLAEFKNKFEPKEIICDDEQEKNRIIDSLKKDNIVHFSKVTNKQTDREEYKINYIPRMTKEDKINLKKLMKASPAVARNYLTWDMLNVRNEQLLSSLDSNTPKKTLKFPASVAGQDREITVFDMTQRQDYLWFIHTFSTNDTYLELLSQEIKQDKLWENRPFISGALQDAFTSSYVGSQSGMHTPFQAFPISLLLRFDPRSIIEAHPKDAKTPEGQHTIRHLKYTPPAMASRLEKDIKKSATPTGSVQETQHRFTGMTSTEHLLKETTNYNEITVLAGELARDWGMKPLGIQALIIEKKQVDDYLSQPLLGIPSSRQKSLAAIIRFAQESQLPVIMIDPTPLKLTQEYEASEIEDQYVPGRMFPVRGKSLSKEVEHFKNQFENKIKDPLLSDQNREWYRDMLVFLKGIDSSGSQLRLPDRSTVEQQVLLSMIMAQATVDLSESWITEMDSTLQTETDEDTRKDALRIRKNMSDKKIKAQDDIQKSKKELTFHRPDINLADIEGLSSKKPKAK